MPASAKIALVTGAGTGVGRAVAIALAKAGYNLVLAGRRREMLDKVAEEINAAGAQGVAVPTDVSKRDSVMALFATVKSTFGRLDVLFNNAGIGAPAVPLEDLPFETWQNVVATNLTGMFLCTQEAARLMVKHKVRGAIINIASTRAFMSEAGTEAYSASKGGIVALTHASAISLGPRGIRVNCISPGWIETRGRKHSSRDRLQHPVGRVGTPEDVASACRYLAEQAGFMTGQNLMLDGGMTVKMIYED